MTNANYIDDEEIKATVHMSAHASDAEEVSSEEDAVAGETTAPSKPEPDEIILKIPPLTPIYWGEKMTATTFGETFADFWTQTLDFGYAKTSLVLFATFLVSLGFQIKVKNYWPVIFWITMSTSSIAGTCVSDFIDRTLGWGYPLGMGVLLSILLFILFCWKLTGLHMNVEGAMVRKQEAFYWLTILVSNTLGTALGDWMSDSLGFGFGKSAGIIGGILVLIAFLAYFSKISHVILFWLAFVLTRPFGATFGDLLTKPKSHGGLDLGTLNASMVILGLFLICFGIENYQLHKTRKAQMEEKLAKQKHVDANENDHV